MASEELNLIKEPFKSNKIYYLRTTLELNRRVTLLNQLKTNEKQFEQMVRDETSVAKYGTFILFIGKI